MTESNEKQGRTANRIIKIAALAIVFLIAAGAIFVAGFFVGNVNQLLTSTTPVIEDAPQSSEASDSPQRETVPPAQDSGEINLDTFWEVWDTLEDRFYYDVPSEDERVQGAIRGLIDSLGDPYTAYVDPDAAMILSEDNSGTFEGIGAYVQEAPEGGVAIIRVFEDGPAEEAGLEAGDIVVKVDDEDITGNILTQSLLLIRGPSGTEVTLTVFREGASDLLDITITRARLEVPTVESEMLEDNIGYVALFDFNARASNRLEEAVRDLLDDGAESIILDLRNNPGGFLDESVSVADMFLPRATVLIQRDVDGNERKFNADNGDFAEDVPLVVLINGNSASASEIVAAAIQDNRRGTLIGETSFGKGSVQLQYTLTDGSMLRVTYAAWYTPNNVSISENGVTPDIIVETPTEPTEEDIQLNRAIEYLQTGE